MKTKPILLAVLLASGATATADTYFVALTTTNNTAANYGVHTNDVITYVGGNSSIVKAATPMGLVTLTLNQTYTGFTNISVGINLPSPAYGSFQITTPVPAACVISNYLPANAIVIPASATGTYTVGLESSPDLFTWTATEPGQYATTGNAKFFRLHAQTQ